MDSLIITLPIVDGSLRRTNSPLYKTDKSVSYSFNVKVSDVPNNIPMETNPRDQNLNSNVSRSIKESLLSNDGYFHMKNRGLLISSESLTYNKENNQVTLVFSNYSQHGNIDGGHTYKIIQDYANASLEQYVRFEVLTGVEDIIEELAESRNISVQVDEKSIAELRNAFEPIKDSLAGMSFYSRIAFRQNQIEYDAEGNKLPMIDAREIISILNIFNPKIFGQEVQPIQAYSSKAVMLKRYLEHIEEYDKLVNVITDVFDLYDTIEMEIPVAYNANGSRRYGSKKFAGTQAGNVGLETKFSQTPIHHRVPTGIIYPILGAFRSLISIDESTGLYKWKKDPFSVWNEIKEVLVSSVMEYSSSIGDNPNAVGKSINIWRLAYMTVAFNQIK